MGCMREHIHRLNSHHSILGVKVLKVTRLGGWIGGAYQPVGDR